MADLHLLKEEETADALLGGALTIFQKKKGYRFSLDALLLSHFVKLKSLLINITT